MLPKSNRLNLRTDFKWVASGKKIETKFIKLFCKTSTNIQARVGIAVSSKSFKKATDRNRARRLVSASFENLYERLPKNINIVALPKPLVLDVKSFDILVDLEKVLKNEKIIS